MIDKILHKTNSLWFMAALVIATITIMALIAVIHASRPDPQIVTGHQTRLYITDRLDAREEKAKSPFLTDAITDDGGQTWWIDVTTPDHRRISCKVVREVYERISTEKTSTFRCLDTKSGHLFSMETSNTSS